MVKRMQSIRSKLDKSRNKGQENFPYGLWNFFPRLCGKFLELIFSKLFRGKKYILGDKILVLRCFVDFQNVGKNWQFARRHSDVAPTISAEKIAKSAQTNY
jgi:hypothetical protein